MEKMNDSKNIHEAYWESICVEWMLKRSHLAKVTPHEDKLPHINDCVGELVLVDMQTDRPELDTEDSASTVGLEISPMSTNNPEVQPPSEEERVVDIPHINSLIDFVFGDQQYQLGDDQWIVSGYDLMVQILQVNHPTVQLHINTNFTHQKQLYMELYTEVVDRSMNQKFARLIFDPSGHFLNSRSSSFQARENDVAAAPISDVRYIVGHMWDP